MAFILPTRLFAKVGVRKKSIFSNCCVRNNVKHRVYETLRKCIKIPVIFKMEHYDFLEQLEQSTLYKVKTLR